MKLSIITILICLAAITAAGQSIPCSLGLNEAPKPSGLQLGMTEAAMLKVFNAKRAEELGKFEVQGKERTFFIVTAFAQFDKDKYELPAGFKDLDSIDLIVAGGKLSKVTLWHVRKKMTATTIQEFTEHLSTSYRLPAAWVFSPTVGKMECSGFRVDAAMTGEFTVGAK